MAGLGAALLRSLARRAIGFARLGGRNGGVGGVLDRLGEAAELLLQFGDGGLQVRDEALLLKDRGLLREDDLDELGLGELLQLLAGHGRGS
jgi:hypothetical protein